MNKKVLTLCAAMLLTGSIATVEAAPKLPSNYIKNGIELVNNGAIIKFTETVDLKGDYLLISENNVTVDGNGQVLKGRIVITGNNVIVKNFANIILKNEVSNFTYYKNAITVVASSVTIENNTFTSEASKEGYMANGVSIFPTDGEGKLVVNNNTFVGFNSETKKDGGAWSSALMVSEGLNSFDPDGDEDGDLITTGKLDKFTIASLGDNSFENCAISYAYSNYSLGEVAKEKAVRPIYENGKIINEDAIKELVTTAASDGTSKMTFNGSAEDFLKIVKNDLSGKKVAVKCDGYNVLIGDVDNPDNGQGALISDVIPALEEVEGYKLIESPAADQYGLLMITAADNSAYIVSQDKGQKASSTPVSTIDLKDYEDADKALWKIQHFVTATGEHQYKFVNKLDEELNPSNTNIENNVFLPKGNAPYSKYGVVLEDINANPTTTYYSFALYKTADKYFTGNELIKRYGDYFTLGITYKDDKKKDVDVTGVFAGQLRPVTEVTYSNGQAHYEDAEGEDAFMLVNEKGNVIVIDKKNPLHSAPNAHGYAFTTITPKQWQERNTPETLKDHEYVAEFFQLAYDYNSADPSKEETVSCITIAGLTVGLEEHEKQIVLVADVKDQLLDTPISIKLNKGNGITADQWLTSPSYYIVENINKNKEHDEYGKVLGLSEGGYPVWVAPENVDLTKPEGQFAITWNGSDYVFTNRESNTSADRILDGALYKVAGETDVYAVVHSWAADNDTLRISPISTYKVSDGFKRFTAADLNANTYTVAMKSLMGDPFIIENHNDKHRLGLSADEYTEWRIEMPTVKLKDATDDFTRMAADTVTVEVPIKYYVANQGWKTTTINAELAENDANLVYNANAALKICTYILKNTDTNEYLYGVDGNESRGNAYYVCDENKESSTLATRIAFKENGEGTVNLVPAYGYYGYYVDNKYYDTNDWMTGMSKKESEYADYTDYLRLSSNKIIGGVSTLTGVLKDEALYKATTNDLFVIEKAEAPTYKKLAQDDKIILTLKENLKDEYVLFEDGDFAGMGNRLAHKDINPTLYVDTAYVNRVDNYAYQYLLSVRPTRIDTTYQCNLPEEHGVHHADTTKGFFLVNMVDSALANQNVHKNKFVYDGEYKLAFVEGYHTNDSLFFTEDGKVVSKMEVGNGDFNIAKYAFKMVDDDKFVVETASGYSKKYNYVKDNNGHEHWTVASVESKPGYLRWVNDNLVVTEDIDKAAIFTMEASDKEATANENIAAGNVVVAGVDGAVVVKGAEGKNVIVSTILGKVVANEVVSSDNATIAAPAGIVVVSVDGESFKVVVK